MCSLIAACDDKPKPESPDPKNSDQDLKKEVEVTVTDTRPLVVYCAHDQHLSESILEKFTKQTGINVEPRFDSERTKSLGLTELLISEKQTPRADVFWNNQLLGMMDLKAQDVLHPYQGKNHTRIPEAFKDSEGYYCGFGGRLRVYILNTELLGEEADYKKLSDIMRKFPEKFAIAEPLYGTTLSHYSALWHHWGKDQLINWHMAFKSKGASIRGGNSKTKNLVASKSAAAGYTDTDDYFLAVDAEAPVKMLPVRIANEPEMMLKQQKHLNLDQGKVVLIPNTVAIIKGSSKLGNAKRLVDFLLSEKIEMALAKGKARQIPLGPVDAKKLPQQVQQMAKLVPQALSIQDYLVARSECLTWLKADLLK